MEVDPIILKEYEPMVFHLSRNVTSFQSGDFISREPHSEGNLRPLLGHVTGSPRKRSRLDAQQFRYRIEDALIPLASDRVLRGSDGRGDLIEGNPSDCLSACGIERKPFTNRAHEEVFGNAVSALKATGDLGQYLTIVTHLSFYMVQRRFLGRSPGLVATLGKGPYIPVKLTGRFS